MTTTQNVKNGPSPDGRGGILRITFDGSIVGSKGILGNSKYLCLYYGYGLRNSFGIGFDPLTGNLWDTENGQRTNDEINLVKPGFNSGWKVIQGTSALKHLDESELENFNGRGRYRDPEFDWVTTVAPTSMLFFNSDKLGKNYENDLLTGLRIIIFALFAIQQLFDYFENIFPELDTPSTGILLDSLTLAILVLFFLAIVRTKIYPYLRAIKGSFQ